MAPAREQDRHRSPISISSSSSPSPPHAWNKVNSSTRPQGVVKLPQRASPFLPREIASHGRMQQWIDDLPSSNNAGVDVSHGLESNSVNIGAQPVPIADFANNTGRPLAPSSVNAGGQLVPQVPGLTYNIGPPQAPPPAGVLRPLPNNREPAADYGRPIPRQLPELGRRPRVRANPYRNERADRRLPVQTLPFNVKHSMLCAMQNVMEGALFYWAKQWAPSLLQKEGWDTPEAGELNHWLRTMNRYTIPPNAFSHSAGMNKAKLGQLLHGRLQHIRHAAVHRDPTITVSALKEMLADAHCLTQGLRDTPRSKKLEAMQLALEEDDIKRMEEMIAAPISTFNDGFDPYKFRTQNCTSGNDLQQKENIRLENSGSMVQQPTMSSPLEPGHHSSDRVKYATEYGGGLGASSGSIIQSVEGQANIGQSQSEYQQSPRLSITNSSAHGRGRSVQRGLRDSNGRQHGLKRKRSETIKFERANQQAGLIKHPGDHIDLTMDSDDDGPPATNPKPAKFVRVIDLTEDESVVLFRSPRAIGAMDGNM